MTDEERCAAVRGCRFVDEVNTELELKSPSSLREFRVYFFLLLLMHFSFFLFFFFSIGRRENSLRDDPRILGMDH